ncbi:MAG: hypothetical protein ACO1N8_09965 [Methylophilus sp.]
MDLSKSFFSILSQNKLLPHLESFLKTYRVMVESNQYSWAYAEYISDNMKLVFSSPEVEDKVRAAALEIAIDAAYRMNRFAAMETCSSMICSVTENGLGVHVAAIMQRNNHSFITDIEPSQCKCGPIINFLKLNKLH